MNSGAVERSTEPNRRKRHRSAKAPAMSFAPSSLPFAADQDERGPDTTRSSISAFREELARELQTEAIHPPETGELIQLLEALQQSAASGDAATRRAIAQFPPEVSDSNKAVEIVTNASEAEQHELVTRIANCASQLDRYNEQLREEATQRAQLNLQLRAFHVKLKERLSDAQTELKELTAKLAHGTTLRQELAKHVSNLPDLHLLPDITAELDPLPSVGDLFG